eukprot:TRINITY_DN74482_c0_g1_i1.p1 TRINITY_DN74482_c0_g1~~TRINITY_DN74482_c0_g1_i1.p1  ORF type:complete len:379 (-),score=65.99 TRINITY_DN74482_c0_g1_i1:427-1503(-)
MKNSSLFAMVPRVVVVLVLATVAVHGDDADSVVAGPWIGILGLPANVECDSFSAASSAAMTTMQLTGGRSCFTNVYAKWVESAGARAVGIPYDAYDTNQTMLGELLTSVNGVLFTGGNLNLSDTGSAYYRTGKYIFEWVKKVNDEGTFYPLTGHCMGFQYLNILAANDNSSVLLTGVFDSEDLSLPLDLTSGGERSRWIERMPASVLETFTKERSTTNLHHDGVTPHTFNGSEALRSFFRVISTNADRKGKVFISTVEAKRYPIVAMQWHPERNAFQWTPSGNISHSPSAVAANYWTAMDLIEAAWKNVQANAPRNAGLIRSFATANMYRVGRSGDALDGVDYLQFEGFKKADFERLV